MARSSKKSDRIMVICAHPDDETLGVGGTIALHSKAGDSVFVLIFATGQFGRDNTIMGINRRRDQGRKACEVLGVKEVKFLNYADQKLDIIPLVELAANMESAAKQWKPNVIYTHYWGDANQDHRRVFDAALIVARPTPSSKIKRFVCFETPSSTEWGNPADGFQPNLFVNIDSVLERKIRAMRAYVSEMNPFPHPRSYEAIMSRTRYWGSSVGMKHAEAFVSIRELVGK